MWAARIALMAFAPYGNQNNQKTCPCQLGGFGFPACAGFLRILWYVTYKKVRFKSANFFPISSCDSLQIPCFHDTIQKDFLGNPKINAA